MTKSLLRMPSAFVSRAALWFAAAGFLSQPACKEKSQPQSAPQKAVPADLPTVESTMARELSQLSGFLEFVETHGDESRLRRMGPAGEEIPDIKNREDLFPAPGTLSLAIAAPHSEEAPEYLVLLDGESPRVVSEKAGKVRNVVAAADGSFAIFESDQASFRDIYRVDLKSGAQVRLTEDGDGAFDPDLSPDAKHVVFVTTASGQADLHLMTSDGKERRSLTETANDETSPNFSPDGASIAYSGDADGPERVFVIPAGGGAPHRLTSQTAPTEHEVEPLWSPTGDMIAFLQDSSAGRSELWVARWPGGKSWRVSAEQSYARQPEWSADGRFLWYSDDIDGNVDIWATRADGSERLRVTDAEGEQWLPRWRPAR